MTPKAIELATGFVRKKPVQSEAEEGCLFREPFPHSARIPWAASTSAVGTVLLGIVTASLEKPAGCIDGDI
jgi:hypothetical protein